jgi:hypothetical protein
MLFIQFDAASGSKAAQNSTGMRSLDYRSGRQGNYRPVAGAGDAPNDGKLTVGAFSAPAALWKYGRFVNPSALA